MKRNLFILVLLTSMLATIAGCASGTVVEIQPPVPNSQAGTPAPNDEITVPGFSIRINAPGPNPLVNTPDGRGRVAGILLGIWHGIISPVTMVLSFVNKDVQMYEVHNDGSQYNLGYLLGVAIVFVLLGVSAGARRR